MTLPWPQLNLLAVIVAGLAAFFLGGIWYMALFGKLWVKLNGYTEEQQKAMQKARPPHIFFGTMLLAYWLMATAMAFLLYWLKVANWMDGACVGLAVWAVVQSVALTDYITSTKRFAVYMLDGAYQLCFLVMTAIILTVWQ